MSPTHDLKLQEAILYLKDHNIYALDKYNNFEYFPAVNGSKVLAPIRAALPPYPYNSRTMDPLPSNRATRTAAGESPPISKFLFNSYL